MSRSFPILRVEKPDYASLLVLLKKVELLFVNSASWDGRCETGDDGEDDDGDDDSLTEEYRREILDWLLKLVACPLDWITEDSEREDLLERAARCVAVRCGKSAAGPVVREWRLPLAPSLASSSADSIILRVRDSTFTEDNVGFKTWGAAYLLAKRISTGRAIPLHTVQSVPILELGTGTGLVGLTCASLKCPRVLLTDHHPQALANARFNVEFGGFDETRVIVTKLDWYDFVDRDEAARCDSIEGEFAVIVAADVVYELEHARLLPRVIEAYLARDGVCFVMLPLRKTHTDVVEAFEEHMRMEGFVLRASEEEQGMDDFREFDMYRYYEWVRS